MNLRLSDAVHAAGGERHQTVVALATGYNMTHQRYNADEISRIIRQPESEIGGIVAASLEAMRAGGFVDEARHINNRISAELRVTY